MRLIDCFSELLAYTVYITTDASAGAVSYDDASSRYEKFLRQAEIKRSRLEISDKDWSEAFFAVSALIDEMVLCSAWPAKNVWQTAQFQHRFFNTTNAGTEFFQHLTSLEPGKDNVREVYDWCLALGFKGIYFRPEDAGDIEEISKVNQGLLHAKRSDQGIPHMFPDAYGIDRKERRKGMSGVFIFAILAGAIPTILFFLLYAFYNNILNGILAGYFQ